MKLIREGCDFDGIGINTPFLLKHKDTGMIYTMTFKVNHHFGKV